MKQLLPATKGFALCEQCYGPLRNELKKHKAYTRKTYLGNIGNWTRDQIRYLAQSLGIDLEKYKKGHKSHVPCIGESNQTDAHNSDLDDLDLPYAYEVPDKFTTFGEQFLSLMEKRPDINRCIQEVLRSKLGTPNDPCRQYHSNNINAPNLSIPTVNQPRIYAQPISHLPAQFPSMHCAPTISPLPSPPTMQVHHPSNLNINFNLHLSNEITNFGVTAFLSEIKDAITVSLQRHSSGLGGVQFSNVQLQFH